MKTLSFSVVIRYIRLGSLNESSLPMTDFQRQKSPMGIDMAFSLLEDYFLTRGDFNFDMPLLEGISLTHRLEKGRIDFSVLARFAIKP